MTQDEIIEMVVQISGCDKPKDDSPALKIFIAFAKLVSAKAIAEFESQERNFCPRCGKRTNDIHTCTPPQGIYYTPPQRTWQGLTNEQIDKAAMTLAECLDYSWTYMPEEGKREMRWHAKAVYEAAHGIKEKNT